MKKNFRNAKQKKKTSIFHKLVNIYIHCFKNDILSAKSTLLQASVLVTFQ